LGAITGLKDLQNTQAKGWQIAHGSQNNSAYSTDTLPRSDVGICCVCLGIALQALALSPRSCPGRRTRRKASVTEGAADCVQLRGLHASGLPAVVFLDSFSPVSVRRERGRFAYGSVVLVQGPDHGRRLPAAELRQLVLLPASSPAYFALPQLDPFLPCGDCGFCFS
jgi:hypothetical protein